MHSCNQNEETNAFEAWFQDNNRATPTGQDLGERYHAVMQMASREVHNPRIGLCHIQKHSSKQMANKCSQAHEIT